MNVPELPEVPDLSVQTSVLSDFNQVSAAIRAKDFVLGLDIQCIHKRDKSKGSAISKLRCKVLHKYQLHFDQLTTKQGMLHWLYIANDVESH